MNIVTNDTPTPGPATPRVIHEGLPTQLPDIDPDETRDWIESFDSMLSERGRERARYVMLRLLERAREKQVGVPALRSTDYINTIPPEREPYFPGDEHIERRIRAFIRWNAAVMVSDANRPGLGVGGHIATYQSSASLYEVGFNHFFRGKEHPGGGDQIFIQGHASPGIYARAFLEGRLSPQQLYRFRQEVQPGADAVLHLLAEAEQLLLVESALEDGTRVDAGGGVALDEDLVAATGVVLATEEVVEPDLVEARCRLVRRDVAADLEARPVRVGDHHRGVPADEGADPALDVLVAREPRLALWRDGVDVVGAAQRGDADVELAGLLQQPQHHVAGPLAAALVDQLVERLQPVRGLVRVDVRKLGGQAFVDHRRRRAGGGGSRGAGSVGCFFGHPLMLSRLGERFDGRSRYRRVHVKPPRKSGPRTSHLPRHDVARLRVPRNSGGLALTRPPRPRGFAIGDATQEDDSVSSTEGGSSTQTGAPGAAERLGFKPGMVIQELGWDSDSDDQLRVTIEDAIDADMVDSDYGNVVDAVVLWWRSEDGDLVDGLVDALTDLVGGGAIWLLTPKVGRPNAVEPADIAEAAPIAGLSQTTTAAVSKEWSATRLIAPKTPA